MFNNFLKSLSIVKKFLFINLIIFIVIGCLTILYISNVKPNPFNSRQRSSITSNADQPTIKKRGIRTLLGAEGQNIMTRTPLNAPIQTKRSTTRASVWDSINHEIGVYVAAIAIKITAWSHRLHTSCILSLQL